MRIVTDPTGREWEVVETGSRYAGAFSHKAGDLIPVMTMEWLRCTSQGESFEVAIGIEWRDLSNDDLWARLARARAKQEAERRAD